MGLARFGPGSSIKLKIVFAHQLHPFGGRYERTPMEIVEIEAGADKRRRDEKDCNGDYSI
jgi:hypothetical protein